MLALPGLLSCTGTKCEGHPPARRRRAEASCWGRTPATTASPRGPGCSLWMWTPAEGAFCSSLRSPGSGLLTDDFRGSVSLAQGNGATEESTPGGVGGRVQPTLRLILETCPNLLMDKRKQRLVKSEEKQVALIHTIKYIIRFHHLAREV